MALIRFIKGCLSAALGWRGKITAEGKAEGAPNSSEQAAPVPPPLARTTSTPTFKSEAQRLLAEAEVILERQEAAPTRINREGAEAAPLSAEDQEAAHRVPYNFKQISPVAFLDMAGMGGEVQPLGTSFIGLRCQLSDYYVRCQDFTGDQAAVLRQLYEEGALRLGWPGDFEAMPDCLAGMAPRTVVVEAWRVIDSITSKMTSSCPIPGG